MGKDDRNKPNGNGHGPNDFDDESISGVHRVYADGTIFRLDLRTGEWEEVDPGDDLINRLTLKKRDLDDDDLAGKVKNAGLKAALAVLTGKSGLTYAVLFALGLGGTGTVSSIMQEERGASAAQVEELTREVSRLAGEVAMVRAELEAHEDLSGHPVALVRIKVVEGQLRDTTSAMLELYRRGGGP